MASTNWMDLYRDGRRLDRIIRAMDTKFSNAEDPELALAYVDRLIKATHEKVEITKIVLKVDEILKAKNIKVDEQSQLVVIRK